VRKYPLPVVVKWLGNTSMIAMHHYETIRKQVCKGPRGISGPKIAEVLLR